MYAMGLVKLHVKPTRYAANILGGLVFGVGFGLLGYCPGTGAAALGQGNWDALAGIVGLMTGSYLFAEASGWLEPVSKPPQDDHEASELSEAMEEEGVELVAGDESAEGFEPTDRALDDPAFTIPPERSAVLRGRSFAAAAMRTDEFDAALGQACAERIAVGRPIVDQPVRQSIDDRLLEQRLDQSGFTEASAVDVDRERQSGAVDQEHELRALAALGRAVVIAPFLAAANVPSAKPSSHSTSPCRSSLRINRRQARSQTPSFDHCSKRRQQVTYEGNERGRSFQRAPVRKIQRMPSTHRRASARGRPPRGSGAGSLNRSEIKDHCSSLSSGRVGQLSGSILDPASQRDRFGISGTPFPLIRTPNDERLASKTKFCNCF
jgi:hypothetical protein